MVRVGGGVRTGGEGTVKRHRGNMHHKADNCQPRPLAMFLSKLWGRKTVFAPITLIKTGTGDEARQQYTCKYTYKCTHSNLVQR